ncbi:pre-60S ribosomal particles component [Rhizina undulata]
MPTHFTKKRKTQKPPAAEAIPDSSADEGDSDHGVSLNDEYDEASSGEDDDGAEGDEFDLDSEATDEGEDDEEEEGEEEYDEDDIDDLLTSSNNSKKRKRNDPDAFATSMSKILSSHLTTTARKDPVLVRAKQNAHEIDESKLEAKARRVLKDEKRKELEKGRVKDIVPKDDEGARKALEREKILRKVAQRGVIKLFNAVRAAQIKGEEASKIAKKRGVVGIINREEKVTEMSKQGFLDLIQSSGKAK